MSEKKAKTNDSESGSLLWLIVICATAGAVVGAIDGYISDGWVGLYLGPLLGAVTFGILGPIAILLRGVFSVLFVPIMIILIIATVFYSIFWAEPNEDQEISVRTEQVQE